MDAELWIGGRQALRPETGAVGGSAVVWLPLHARRFSRSLRLRRSASQLSFLPLHCTFRRSISNVDCSFASFLTVLGFSSYTYRGPKKTFFLLGFRHFFRAIRLAPEFVAFIGVRAIFSGGNGSS